MKKQFIHKFSTSYLLWFENFLNKKGHTYKTEEIVFKYSGPSSFLSGVDVWQSNYDSIAYDLSLENVIVNPTISLDEGKLAKVQFVGGNIICPPAHKDDIKLLCSPQECSVSFSNLTEGEVITNVIEEALEKKKKKKNVVLTPKIVLCVDDFSNEPFAFGGMVNSRIACKAVVFSQDQFFLDGVLSIFNDSKDEIFVEIDDENYPLDEMGSLKNKFINSGGFDYNNIASSSIANKNNIFHIESAYCSKSNDKISRESTANFYIGFIEFDITCERYRE